MGITNLKQALQHKMGLWAGELNDREKKVAEILSLYESLPEHNARAERLRTVLDCAGEVMREIDPIWTPDTVNHARPNVRKNGVKLGNTTKLALDSYSLSLEIVPAATWRDKTPAAVDYLSAAGVGYVAFVRRSLGAQSLSQRTFGRPLIIRNSAMLDSGWMNRNAFLSSRSGEM